MNKLRDCAAAGHLQPVPLDGTGSPRYRRSSQVRKREEFTADVYLTAKRTLTDPTEWATFRLHYLYGADWKLTCKQIGLPYQENKDRKNFFHKCYQLESTIGRVFQELRPFALFPTDEYFQVVAGRTVDTRPLPIPRAVYPNGVPLRPPMAPRPQAVRAPAPSPSKLKPAPAVVPLAIISADTLAGYIRKAFGAGRTLRSIAEGLVHQNVPAPNGKASWTGRDVRDVLLYAPCKQAARPGLPKAA